MEEVGFSSTGASENCLTLVTLSTALTSVDLLA